MPSTNKTTNYELSQYIGTDKPTYLGDYNSDMLKIDTGMHQSATDAATALSTANSAAEAATTASTAASTAVTTANTAKNTADSAAATAATASTNAATALTAAHAAETAAEANTITNLAPAYDPTLTYDVDDLVTYIDDQGSGKLYKCIIAVDTPMEFNINYWDDVTTSEVYARASEVYKTIPFTTSDSWATVIPQLVELLDFDYETISKTVIIYETDSFVMHFTIATRSPSSIYMSYVRADTSSATIASMFINASTPKFTEWYVSSSGNAVADLTSTNFGAEGNIKVIIQ